MTEEEKAKLPQVKAFTGRFDEAMDDDVNTADAVSVVFDLVKFANSEAAGEISREYAKALKEEILMLGDILGLRFEKKEEVLDSEIEELIAERQAARKAKDFKKADEIRGRLLEMGITVLDTREGVKWKRS